MVELVLILYGADVVRRRWWLLALAGLLWFGLGLAIFVNALLEEVRINPVWFAIPLVIDGLLSLGAAFASIGAGKGLRYAKAGLFLFLALLIYATAGRADMVIGITVGLFLLVDGGWRASSAYVVRFQGWRRAIGFAAFEVALAVWSFIPWPTRWRGQVGEDVGLLLMYSALGICALAWRLAWLPPGAPISRAVARGILKRGRGLTMTKSLPSLRPITPGPRITATVHVWTPTGALASVDRAVSRYVAARDAQGVISTGHAALEAAGIYISHYPAVEIERSPDDFRRTLRATHDNDVPGRFQPSYAEEAAGWCESTMKVAISGLDAEALRRFWEVYGADTTYNLTSRNCSSTVATALDAGLESILAPHAGRPYVLLRLLFSPELWIAGQLRRRAATMAWTPGIVLDYARALSYLVALPGRLGLTAGEERPATLPPRGGTEPRSA